MGRNNPLPAAPELNTRIFAEILVNIRIKLEAGVAWFCDSCLVAQSDSPDISLLSLVKFVVLGS